MTPWRDSAQVRAELEGRFDETELKKVHALFALHFFMRGALPTKGLPLHSAFEKAIFLSEYGQKIVSAIDISSYTPADVAFSSLLTFFHRDFFLDIRKCEPHAAIKMFEHELITGSLRLPQRFGRVLYDKFNDTPGPSRVGHLTPSEVDALLEGTEQGIYQIGEFITGPLGIIESDEKRFVPPAQNLPLWHCADPGCQMLHTVDLLKHPNPAYSLAQRIIQAAKRTEGPPSDWQRPVSEIHRRPWPPRGKDYYDVTTLIADAMPASERIELLLLALRSAVGPTLRTKLKDVPGNQHFDHGSPDEITSQLTDGSVLQLLMSLTDIDLIRIIDESVSQRRIKIPPTETRKAKAKPPKSAYYDSSSTLSIFGIRSDRDRPVLFLSSIIWDEYERLGQLPNLAWLCQKSTAHPTRGEPMNYMKTHSAREVVQNLILTSRPIALAIANRLRMELMSSEPDEQTIDRFLWKFGFNPARYDKKYSRLKSQLQQLREQAIRSPQGRLSDDDRDAIRSKGVNVFVSLENFIEELIAFNTWLLSSDHFAITRFEYKFEDAASHVPAILGESINVGDQVLVWKVTGGNTLGTLLAYARAAADWMLGLPAADPTPLEKSAIDLPHFVDDRVRRFPFRHQQLWADAQVSELKDFAERFNSLVSQLERSRLAEVRNGLDHYREEDRFPNSDLIIACESRLAAMVDSADENRFIPKTYWLSERRENEFGIAEDTLQDYGRRKLTLKGPPVVIGVKRSTFLRPSIIPHGNLLGDSNSELIFYPVEESPYSKMWANYPRRRKESEEVEHKLPTSEDVSLVP